MTVKGGLVSNRPFVTPSNFAGNIQGNCLFFTSEQTRWKSEKRQRATLTAVQIVITGGGGRSGDEEERQSEQCI